MLPKAKGTEGQVTATNYQKSDKKMMDSSEIEKRPDGCEDCLECGECAATAKLERLRRQNSVVTRMNARVLALLEKALASG